jgi:hypothetical protein
MRGFFLLFLLMHSLNLKGQNFPEQKEDDFKVITLYDTLEIDFDISFCDAQMNFRQSQEYEKKRVKTLEKLKLLRVFYNTTPKDSINIDSVLLLAADLYRECESHFKALVVDKKTFYFTVRYTRINSHLGIWKNDTTLHTPRAYDDISWKIDTITYVLPTISTNSPFEFVVEVDSTIKQNGEFILYYKMYRQGFTQSKNTFYRVKDKHQNLVLKHKGNTCTLSAIPSYIKIGNNLVIMIGESFASAFPYNLPENEMHWSGFDYGRLDKRVNPFLQWFKTGYWNNYDYYRVPILVAGEGLTRFARSYHYGYSKRKN